MIVVRLDRWIHGFLPVTPEGLALSRIFYAGFWLVTAIPTFAWVSDSPPGFYNPPPLSLGALFTDFPARPPMVALDLLLGALLVCLLVGWRTKPVSLALSLLWIVGNTFSFSFGKIHHTILAVVTPAVMAFSGWGATLSVDAKRSPHADVSAAVRAWPVSLLAVLLAFGFFSAGLPKLRAWLDFDLATQGARSWLLRGWYAGDRKLLAPLFVRIGSPHFWELVDLTAVTFEVGFSLSLLRARLFRTFVLAAIVFHFVNLLMLNIAFEIMLPVYAVFAPWERIVPRIPGRVFAFLERLTTVRGLAVVLALVAPLYLFEGRVSADTAAFGFSHLGVLADRLGDTEYLWQMEVVVVSLAPVVALVLALLPRRAPNELARTPL